MKTIMTLVLVSFLVSGVTLAQPQQPPVDTKSEATDSESHRDLIRDTNPEQDNGAAALDNNDEAINPQGKSDIDNSDVDNSDTEPQGADIDNSDAHY